MGDVENQEEKSSEIESGKRKKFERFDTLNPLTTSLLIFSHSLALYTVVLFFMRQLTIQAMVFQFILAYGVGLSNAVGCHRYWSHRSFKAKLPLQILLAFLHTFSCQGSIYTWVRWHRIHHKYSDTDADPHNAQRGFLYAQIGWIFMYDHQKFMRNSANETYTADLERDKVVMWQYRNYNWLAVVFAFLPGLVTWQMGWQKCYFNAFATHAFSVVAVMFVSNAVNSFAHLYGTKPYDKAICATQNRIISLIAAGEGWHNYHHSFPWDYRSSEYGLKLNSSTMFIDLCHWLGLATDLKTASKNIVVKRAALKGDGSRSF